ncbi:MAG: hypothetical protein RRZ64_05420 [Rikenellaceae bacterium]
MFTTGNLLYIHNYHFSNGNPSKPKYLLVLDNNGTDVVVMNLPTSKAFIPDCIDKQHGCINDAERDINCYYFQANRVISDNGFSFPKDTFVYSQQVGVVSLTAFENTYNDTDCFVKCLVDGGEFRAIKECLKHSNRIKNKIKQRL